MAQQNKEHKIKRFRLLLNDDASHKNLWMLKFTKGQSIIAVITIFILFCAILWSLIAYTPIRTFIPGYPDAQTRRLALQNVMKIDSLENMAGRWSIYAENLRRVLDGEAPMDIDSLVSFDTDSISDLDPSALSRKDSLLRSTVMKEEQFNISGKQSRALPLEGLLFFAPIQGIVTQGYDEHIHPFVDITAEAGTPVKATLDGTVIYTGWDESTGNVIQIQHSGDIVSIYKHNQKLLKKTGDVVKAGTPIALLGNTGKVTNGPHLHFELWYKGKATDPTKYINF